MFWIQYVLINWCLSLSSNLLSIERVSILISQELRLVLVLVVELLVPLQLLTGLVPLAGPLDLEAVHVRRDRLDVVSLHQGLAVVTTKEPHLHLPIAVLLVVDHLGWPVGEPLLLGVHNLVERSAGLGKPIFVVPGNKLFLDLDFRF